MEICNVVEQMLRPWREWKDDIIHNSSSWHLAASRGCSEASETSEAWFVEDGWNHVSQLVENKNWQNNASPIEWAEEESSQLCCRKVDGHFTKFSCWNSCSREVLSLRMWSWWQVALVHHSMVNRPWGSGLSKLMDHGIQNLKKGFYFARKITWFRETHMTNVKSWAEDVKHI